MCEGAHGGANGFGVELIDGWRNDGEILIAETDGTTHDSAKIAGVGWIYEDDMIGCWGDVSFWFGEFCNKKTIILGAENIKCFGRLDDGDLMLFEGGNDSLDVVSEFYIRTQKYTLN